MSLPRQELRSLAGLAGPVVVTQVGTMLMGVVDILMVGQVGVEALGAVSLGRIWVFGTMLFALGMVLGIDPIVTQAHGARDGRRMGIALQHGVVLSGLLSIPLGLFWLLAEPGLVRLGQDPELAAMAQGYVSAQIPSIPFFFLFLALRQYLQGRAILRPALIVVLVSNLFNVFFNWIFIFGHWGAPALGVTGAGVATNFIRITMFGGLLWMVLRGRLYEGAWEGWSREAFSWRGLKEVMGFGFPVGLAMGLEIWAFEIATLFSGRLGTVELAAHTVVLNVASFTFMFPLGISQAAVTRVGNLIGENHPGRAQIASWMAFALGAAVMLTAAVLFVIFRHVIPRAYTDDLAVVGMAAAIFPIAAAFQLFDGTQVVGGGILRGMGRTRPAAAFNVIGYYLLGLPLGWWLAFRAGWGVQGIWWGLCAGLGVIALLLVLYVQRHGPAREGAAIRVVSSGA